MVEKLLSLPSPRPKGLFFLLEAAFLVLGGPFSPSAWPLERGGLISSEKRDEAFSPFQRSFVRNVVFCPPCDRRTDEGEGS